MGMKVSKDTMSPEEFRKFAERMSKYVDLRGCETEEDIIERIKQRKSINLNGLIKGGFAARLYRESWENPHPVYKEILSMHDDVYDMWVEEKRDYKRRLKE